MSWCQKTVLLEPGSLMKSSTDHASRLGLSTPSTASRIAGVRAASGVSLTEAGRGLLAVVGDALGRIESAASHIATPGGAPIKVGISLTLSMGWLTPRLPAFQAAHPSVMLELYSLMRRPELPPRDTSLWIAFGPPPPGTVATRRFGETIIPVAAREVADQITSTEDMLNNTLIEVADHRRNWTQIFGGEVLPQGARVTYVDATAAALALAAQGGGIALARPPATRDLEARYDLVPCLPDLSIPGVEAYHLIKAAGVTLSPGAQAFHDWVLDQA